MGNNLFFIQWALQVAYSQTDLVLQWQRFEEKVPVSQSTKQIPMISLKLCLGLECKYLSPKWLDQWSRSTLIVFTKSKHATLELVFLGLFRPKPSLVVCQMPPCTHKHRVDRENTCFSSKTNLTCASSTVLKCSQKSKYNLNRFQIIKVLTILSSSPSPLFI